MPARNFTDAGFYSGNAMKNGQAYQFPETVVSVTEYLNMMKRMGYLEEKLITLSKEPTTMPPEKEEQLNNALSRVDALEQELNATKKVLITLL